jgi:hypothetical protein
MRGADFSYRRRSDRLFSGSQDNEQRGDFLFERWLGSGTQLDELDTKKNQIDHITEL